MVVYMIWCETTEMVYVGQTAGDLGRRIAGHRRCRKRDARLAQEIRTLGWDAFEVFVLEQCISLEQLNEREAWWVEHMHATESTIGYNIRAGGDNHLLSASARELCAVAGRSAGAKLRGPRSSTNIARAERKRLWTASDADGRRELLRSWGRKGAEASRIA